MADHLRKVGVAALQTHSPGFNFSGKPEVTRSEIAESDVVAADLGRFRLGDIDVIDKRCQPRYAGAFEQKDDASCVNPV